jgi:hypothetical protein
MGNIDSIFISLKNELSCSKSFHRMATCEQLGDLKTHEAYDAIFHVAQFDTDVDVRSVAIGVLGLATDDYVFAMLLKIADAGDDEVDSQCFTPSESAKILLSIFGQ